ncbi:DUF2789 family protein [Roseateles microcysteis]|uniref:DUF2789 family protein n=1 Tax=Roseateles microcysteis TaxID=3119057 RepID=UPI002FE522BA
MEASFYTGAELFQQLGLPDSPAEMDHFIREHRPLPAGQLLCDAAFWDEHQAQFLREGMARDAVWVGAIEELNRALSA